MSSNVVVGALAFALGYLLGDDREPARSEEDDDWDFDWFEDDDDEEDEEERPSEEGS